MFFYLLPQLAQLIVRHFDIAELRELCLIIQVEFDEIHREGKTVTVNELVKFCDRRGLIPQLIEACRHIRSQVVWPSYLAEAQSNTLFFDVRLHKVPVDYVPRIVDGVDLSQHISEKLVTPGESTIVLFGMGGSGKTTLAAKVVSDLSKNYSVRTIWIQCDKSLAPSFRALVKIT